MGKLVRVHTYSSKISLQLIQIIDDLSAPEDMMKTLIAVIAQAAIAARLCCAVDAIGDRKGFSHDRAEFVSNLLDMAGASGHIVIQNDGLLPATSPGCMSWKQYAINIGSFDLQRVTCAMYQCIHQ